MKRNLMFLLVICLLLSSIMFSPAAFAEGWSLPEGTPMFGPGCVMKLDFGTFTVLDAGFAKKVELAYTISSWTKTKNGVTEEHNDVNEYYHTAEDGTAFFVTKGVLQNTSGETFSTKNIHPEICFGDGEPFSLDAFPAAQMIGDGTLSPGLVMDLEPGMSINVDFACTVPAEHYHSDADILFSFAGTDLGFQRSGLQSYVSMGFEEGDGELTKDVTLLIDEAKAAAEQKEKAAEAPHIDEVSVEGVSLTYDEKRNCYVISAKVRNNGYPTLTDWPTVSSVSVRFRFLDSAGDGILSNCDSINNMNTLPGLASGEAAWAGGFTIDVGVVDTAESIIFDSYSVLLRSDSKDYAQSIQGTISNPPVFKLDDIIPGRADAKKLAESDAVAVDNVTVDFADFLPPAVMASTAYRGGIDKFHYTLTDSETYAVIRFAVTNMTTKEITLADIGGDFFIELNFNDGFIYSTKGSKACVLQSGNEIAVMEWTGSKSSRIGDAIVLPPLVTYDVVAYIPCAKLVATMTDKPLLVSFHTTQTGDKQLDVKVR